MIGVICHVQPGVKWVLGQFLVCVADLSQALPQSILVPILVIFAQDRNLIRAVC